MTKYMYTEKQMKQILSSIEVLVDTREKINKNILDFFDEKGIQYRKKKLDFADYSFMITKNEELGIFEDIYFDRSICIEKKNSLDELAQNFSADRDRIEREFIRHEGKMILLIEVNTYDDAVKGNYKSKYPPQSFIGTLHSFSLRYDVPFIFIPKENTAQFIYFTFFYWLRNHIKTNKLL